MESLQGKGRTSAVAEQPFDSSMVVTLDADGGVDAESAGALPDEHAVGIGFVEQAVRAEVAEHATLDDALEVEPVVGLKEGGLIEMHLIIGGL